MELDVVPREQPAWQLTALFSAPVAVSSHPSGRWSIVGAGGSIEGESLDDVLCCALRAAEGRDEEHGRATEIVAGS